MMQRLSSKKWLNHKSKIRMKTFNICLPQQELNISISYFACYFPNSLRLNRER